jgi:flavin reductase (DIM6/NTAB) family NADH-FMN oxidoreductase RutF
MPSTRPNPRSPAAGCAESERLRHVLRTCPTGVTVVTSAGDDQPYGVTVSAFTSVSLDPQLILVCLHAESSAAATIDRNGVFAVNVLSAGQESLARRFASPTRPRGAAAFDGVAYATRSTGAPILDNVACWLDCRYTDIHVAGDHVVVIGEVLDFAGDTGLDPLVFHAGRYRVVRDREGRTPSPGPPSPFLSPTYFAEGG